MAERRAATDEVTNSLELVRIERRPRTADRIDGFIVAVGEKWALIQATTGGGYFDGFVAIRVRDVVMVKRDASFEGRFAQTQPEWPPGAPAGVDLDRTKRLIESMARLAPIIGIEQEHRAPGTQWIGVPVGYDRRRLILHEVRPDATWREEPFAFKFRRITRVEIGNHYKKALATVMHDHTPPHTGTYRDSES